MADLYLRASVLARLTASSLACSPRQLQRAFDEIGRTSFGAQLRSMRIRNAVELLATQSLTVADVARLVDYESSPHFVTTFRAAMGRRPAPTATGRAARIRAAAG